MKRTGNSKHNQTTSVLYYLYSSFFIQDHITISFIKFGRVLYTLLRFDLAGCLWPIELHCIYRNSSSHSLPGTFNTQGMMRWPWRCTLYDCRLGMAKMNNSVSRGMLKGIHSSRCIFQRALWLKFRILDCEKETMKMGIGTACPWWSLGKLLYSILLVSGINV